MVVKINALVGPYKYIPGTCVSLAVTNKKIEKNNSKLHAEKDR